MASVTHCDAPECQETWPKAYTTPPGWVRVTVATTRPGTGEDTERVFCSREHAAEWLGGSREAFNALREQAFEAAWARMKRQWFALGLLTIVVGFIGGILVAAIMH